MKHRVLFHALLAAALTSTAGAAAAAGINDPANDFIPSFTGAHNGDLDVLSAVVTYNPGSNVFFFSATMNGAIGTTPNSTYVWGIDRGTGTARFGALATGVFFDTVFSMSPTVASTVTLLPGGATTLPAGSVSFSGNTISGSFSGALLPTAGFDPTAYTWNLWPRDLSQAGNAAISDFAPDNSNVVVAVVPEPSTVVLLALGLGAVAWRARRRVAA